MIIGDRLRALREAKKLSLRDVEKRTGLLRAYISRVEGGDAVPAIRTLEKLARAVEVPMYQLFYEGEEPFKLPRLSKWNPGHNIAWVRSGKPPKGRISSWSRILLMLETQRKCDSFDREALGKLAEAIVSEGSKQKSRKALQQWLEKQGEAWLVEKRPALAAVIEAATRLSLTGTETFIAKALTYKHTDFNVASVAAQRVRWFPISDSRLRRELWHSLKYWIELWLEKSDTEKYALLALPSVPLVAKTDAVTWLCDHVTTGTGPVAWSTALGILEWAATGKAADGLSDEAADAFSTACINRLHQELESRSQEAGFTPPLLPTLVWVLGATATEKQLPRVAQILADSFRSPRTLEDAAALRAGRLLVSRWREKGLQALAAAFGGCSSDDFLRYNAGLLLKNR